MKNITINAAFAAVLAMASSASSAEENSFEWNLAVAKASYAEQMTRDGIEDSSMSYAIYGNYDHGHWLSSVGLEYLDYSATGHFTQQTTDGNKSSDASGFLINAAFGPKWQLGEGGENIVFVQAGYSYVASSEHSIDRCIDCASVDIEMDDGVFLKAAYLYNFSHFALGLQATQYVTGDGYENNVGLILSTAY